MQVITEPDAQTRTWIKDRLAPLVGLETNTEPPQQRRGVHRVATVPGRDRGAPDPTVLVIEDLHWADEAFVAFLEHLAERTAGCRCSSSSPPVPRSRSATLPGRPAAARPCSRCRRSPTRTRSPHHASLPEADPS